MLFLLFIVPSFCVSITCDLFAKRTHYSTDPTFPPIASNMCKSDWLMQKFYHISAAESQLAEQGVLREHRRAFAVEEQLELGHVHLARQE